MSKRSVGSRGFDGGNGRGKETIGITSRSGGDIWELRRDMGGIRSGLTSATSLECISKSTSSAWEYFKNKSKSSKENESVAHHV